VIGIVNTPKINPLSTSVTQLTIREVLDQKNYKDLGENLKLQNPPMGLLLAELLDA